MTSDQVPRVEAYFNEKSSKDIVFLPKIFSKDGVCYLYELEIRFSNSKYSRKEAVFERLKKIVDNCSGYSMILVSDSSSFARGIMQIGIGCCNHGFRFDHLTKMVDKIKKTIEDSPAD